MSDERPEGLPKRTADELAGALTGRSHYLAGESWEIPATLAMMLEAADLLREQSTALARLEAWKAEALQSLEKWHALGDALLPFAKLTLGQDIPVRLTEQIPAVLARLDRGRFDQPIIELPGKHPLRIRAEAAEAEVTRLREERDRRRTALHSQIMDIPADTRNYDGFEVSYKHGHRDARHAAAELVAAALSSPSASEKSPKAV